MNKVILLVLLMPVTAFGQIMVNSKPGNLPDLIQGAKADIIHGRADPGAVVISEIMADPSPSVSLPAKEYIELHNRTQQAFNLRNWTLSDGNSRCTFPERIIPPGSYMILCQLQDTLFFKNYGLTTGLKSFPALTNSGKILFISDSTATMIHGIEYSSDWYGDILKSGGGWSLEMIDTDYPFFQKGNWRASLSVEGGTPGRINSVSAVNPDNLFSGIENVFPVDSITITIRFSETLFGLNDNIDNIEIAGAGITDIFPSDPLKRTFTSILHTPLQNGKIYTMIIGNDVTDFAGNQAQKDKFSFGLPENINTGNILFNELLFNPFPGEPDFIEFYNCSERIIDASDLLLVSVNDESNDTSSIVFVSTENRCILPRNYNVITTDRNVLLNRFYSSDPDRVFEVSDLPSMPDDDGHLILYVRQLEKIDEVFYGADMHYSLLSGYEGISLEKIRPCSQSADRSQWHSASESSGWGTPGSPNSVLSKQAENKDPITLSSSTITPDNDGNNDFLEIDLKLKGLGNIVSVTIFDESGYFVKMIADNLLAGPDASIVWNATNENGRLVNTGIYILLITIFDDAGKTEKWKKVCTVIR